MSTTEKTEVNIAIRYVTDCIDASVLDFIEIYYDQYLVSRIVNPGLTSATNRANGHYGLCDGHFGWWSGGGGELQYHMPDQSMYVSFWFMGVPANYDQDGFPAYRTMADDDTVIPTPGMD